MMDKVEELLQRGPIAVNVGVREFADTLRAQGVEVTHVEWTPPAGGDAEMIDLLNKLL